MPSNYFVRHWRGELALPISYWVNGNLLVGVAMGGMGACLRALSEASLRQFAAVSIVFLVFSVLVWLWGVVGIWRSARRHKARGGSVRWAGLAQAMVVVAALALAWQLFFSIVPQIRTYAEIAVGNDPIGTVNVALAANGQAVILSGILREGSARYAKKVLDAAPDARTLVLNSGGGRLLEARRLADVVRERKLNTYVEAECSSACTYVFLAGIDRAATPNAKIGFHQPDFVGFDSRARAVAMEQMAAIYRQAGLPQEFIERIRQTGSAGMWYPTRQELAKANVINRLSLGGETAAAWTLIKSKADLLSMIRAVALFQAYEKRFPGTIELAVEQGWAMKELGKSDGEIQNAIREIVGRLVPDVLKSADGETLLGFVELFVAQAKAARAISPEACSLYIDGRLDIANTLPRRYVEMEQAFMIAALAAPPRSATSLPRDELVKGALAEVLARLSLEQRKVALTPAAYGDRPQLKCDVTLAIYQTVLDLPPPQRQYALHGLLQAD